MAGGAFEVEGAMLVCLFVISIVGIIYAYAGYPLLLLLAGRRRPLPAPPDDPGEFLPSIEMLVAAYNEEDVIAAKIDNALASDYPGPLRVTIVSDGSTDRTDAIVRRRAEEQVSLLRVEGRGGKSVARNAGVANSKAEILIMTDANAVFRPDAVSRLVRWFRDPSTAVVCGQLRLLGPRGTENPYWRYEKRIKRLEARFHSIIGANGSIYAIRRSLYRKLPRGIDDDFAEPVLTHLAGNKVLYDDSAVSEEPDIPAADLHCEFAAKRRVVQRGLQTMSFILGHMHPMQDPATAFQLFSHKIMKWSVPFLMILALLTNVFLTGRPFFAATLDLQALAYLAAALGIVFRWRLLRIPAFFVVTNAAVLAAVISFLRGARATAWERSRGGS
jgi:glycosyltransferase involved in cell wall biosynthesis